MKENVPLFTAVDVSIRTILIIFLLYYAIRFRSRIMLFLIATSSLTIYLMIFQGLKRDGTVLTILGQISAFIVVYILYEYMRMKWVIKGMPTIEEAAKARGLAMDNASELKKNLPNTRTIDDTTE